MAECCRIVRIYGHKNIPSLENFYLFVVLHFSASQSVIIGNKRSMFERVHRRYNILIKPFASSKKVSSRYQTRAPDISPVVCLKSNYKSWGMWAITAIKETWRIFSAVNRGEEEVGREKREEKMDDFNCAFKSDILRERSRELTSTKLLP